MLIQELWKHFSYYFYVMKIDKYVFFQNYYKIHV